MSKPKVEDRVDEQGRQWYGIESENLCEATWNAGTLSVRFNSTRMWEYQAVPEELWKEFKATFSVGRPIEDVKGFRGSASTFFGANFRNWKGLSGEVK